MIRRIIGLTLIISVLALFAVGMVISIGWIGSLIVLTVCGALFLGLHLLLGGEV